MPDKTCKGFLPRAHLSTLIDVLTKMGFKVIAPQVRDGAIEFSELDDIRHLPWGVKESVTAGSYRLSKSDASGCFLWNTGPQGLKPWLFKPHQTLWVGELHENGVRFSASEPDAEPLAFVGVRACDIAALYLQDKHFMHSEFPDPWYCEQRKKMCLIAVNCRSSAATCFCVSTGDGPAVSYGFDVALDEIDEGYVLHTKSDTGITISAQLPLETATKAHMAQAKRQSQQATEQQKKMPDEATLTTLLQQLNNQQWQSVAQRCLACGNCTSVCPTCFCSGQSTVETEVAGQYQQTRHWDSCFSEPHGYIAGKRIRGEISQRYRQWLIHKLVTWQEQYGRSGCTGCGRCISWCPAGIDLVDEVHALLAST